MKRLVLSVLLVLSGFVITNISAKCKIYSCKPKMTCTVKKKKCKNPCAVNKRNRRVGKCRKNSDLCGTKNVRMNKHAAICEKVCSPCA